MEKLGRNDLCWCGSGKKYKKCPCSVFDYIKHDKAFQMYECKWGYIKNNQHLLFDNNSLIDKNNKSYE